MKFNARSVKDVDFASKHRKIRKLPLQVQGDPKMEHLGHTACREMQASMQFLQRIMFFLSFL